MAKYLDSKEIIESRQKIIDDLDNKVENIRTKARMEREVYKKIVNGKSKKPISLTNQYDGNIISILGGRGFGKSSIAYTFLKELDNKKENIVFDIIDPQKFKSAQDLMLWVIGYFVTWIDYLEKIDSRENRYCEKKNNELKMKFDEVKKHVVLNNSYSNQNLSSMSQSIHDLVEYNQQVSFSNIFFDKKWKDFLECFFYRYKDEINDSNITERNPNEPLLFITIDDADLSSEYGFNILTDINNYFRHPNIVVLVLGDYEEFYQNIYLSYLQNDNLELEDTASEKINSIKQSIEEKTFKFLDKILIREQRLSLESLSVDEIYKFKIKTFLGDNNKIHESYISVRELLNKEVLKFYVDDREQEMNLGEYLSETKIENYISKDGKDPDHGIFKDYKMLQEKDLDKEKKGFDCYVGFQEDCKTFFDDIDSLNSLNEEAETKKDVEYKDKIIERPFLGIFPDNPRDLISFFYEIKDRLNKKDKKLSKLRLNKSQKKQLSDESEKNNQLYLELLYNMLRNNLSEVEKKQVDNILEIKNSKWIFKFDEIIMAFESYDVKLRNYRIPRGTIDFYSVNSGEKIAKKASLLVQLIYDLCYDYRRNRIEKKGKLEFEYGLNEKTKELSTNNVLYHSQNGEFHKDKSIWKVYLCPFPRFRDHYNFIEMYRICIPIVESNKGILSIKQERLRRCFINLIELVLRSNQKKCSIWNESIYHKAEIDNLELKERYDWKGSILYERRKGLENRINCNIRENNTLEKELYNSGTIMRFVNELEYTYRGFFKLTESNKRMIVKLYDALNEKEICDRMNRISSILGFEGVKYNGYALVRDSSANEFIETIAEELREYLKESEEDRKIFDISKVKYAIERLYYTLDEVDLRLFKEEKIRGYKVNIFTDIVSRLAENIREKEDTGEKIERCWREILENKIQIEDLKDNYEFEKLYKAIDLRVKAKIDKGKLTNRVKKELAALKLT